MLSQHTLADATLMSMGKGFTITSNLDLGKQLRDGYSKAKSRRKLLDVQIVAIVNDTVATLISSAHQIKARPQRKAAMGLKAGKPKSWKATQA
jgi:hexokinase